MEKLLGVFDFDFTIIKENSDIVARDLLSAEVIADRLKVFRSSQGWTSYMCEVFKLLSEEGITVQNLENAIVSIPAVPDFVKLFRDLKSINCDIIIISDSNTFFIEKWLESKGLRQTVHTIYSNPAHIESGKLHLQPYHNQDWCKLSTRNLCKGHILLTHIEKEEAGGSVKYSRVFYVGDGHNDLCPSLKLNKEDYIFPRLGFPLIGELRSAGKDLKANVIPWDNTDQIWNVVKNL